jgi:hypothetical protein
MSLTPSSLEKPQEVDSIDDHRQLSELEGNVQGEEKQADSADPGASPRKLHGLLVRRSEEFSTRTRLLTTRSGFWL